MPYACWISAKPSKLKLATIDNGFYQMVASCFARYARDVTKMRILRASALPT
jgi:hypothetical protein